MMAAIGKRFAMSLVINSVGPRDRRLPTMIGRSVAWIVWFGVVGIGFAMIRPALVITLGVAVATSLATVAILIAAMVREPGSRSQWRLRHLLTGLSPLLLGSMLWLATFAGAALFGGLGITAVTLGSLILFAAAVVVEVALAAALAVQVARRTYDAPATIVAVLIAERFCGLLGETR